MSVVAITFFINFTGGSGVLDIKDGGCPLV
jgi:hypothetical protein